MLVRISKCRIRREENELMGHSHKTGKTHVFVLYHLKNKRMIIKNVFFYFAVFQTNLKMHYKMEKFSMNYIKNILTVEKSLSWLVTRAIYAFQDLKLINQNLKK